jgi:hypothetical protein
LSKAQKIMADHAKDVNLGTRRAGDLVSKGVLRGRKPGPKTNIEPSSQPGIVLNKTRLDKSRADKTKTTCYIVNHFDCKSLVLLVNTTSVVSLGLNTRRF